MKKLFCLLAALALLVQPLRAAEEPKRYLALTFDDGPSGELTERLLEGLAERQVHATFLSAATALRNFRIRFHTSPQPVTRSACTAATMIICRRWTMERRCAI